MGDQRFGVAQIFRRLTKWYGAAGHDALPAQAAAPEAPLRAELFNAEQLNRHAKELAASHKITPKVSSNWLLRRLEENERLLNHTYDLITAAVKKGRRIVPACEWLLDNFFLVEEQTRAARRHLPRSFSRELPRLADGPAAGLPRVYGIALELISHVDGNVDLASLSAFVAAYQSVQPLSLGELWAMPIMLRLALLENLRRVAARLSGDRLDRDAADEWAQRMVAAVEKNPSDVILVLADMVRANLSLSSAFLAELTRQLQAQSQHFAFAQTWLENRLGEQGLQLGQLVEQESQTQAADQVSVGNSITSLRVLSSADWREFVEEQSVVEKTLDQDPAGVYADMNFATRDLYRHAVEEIARRSRRAENQVALQAIAMAKPAQRDAHAGDDRTTHVGYYLIDKGRPALERAIKMPWSLRLAAGRLIRRWPLVFYLAPALALAVALTALALHWAKLRGLGRLGLALALAPLLIGMSQVSIAIVNWLVSALVRPRSLPRMDYRQGIPREFRTIVVVPTMLHCQEAIDQLIEGLEIHYLANADDNLQFALLTDFRDAPQEVMPEDEALIRRARQAMEALARKYQERRPDIFFLFHRPRRFNAHDRIWMGYERKRGKLAEFNAVLRGGSTSRFSLVLGDAASLRGIRYVITLDSDTQLPRDSAQAMVGAMAHPLNRPVFDAKRRRVVQGYGILQPRVGVSLPSASRSWFARLFAADAGLDPYTRVISDLYQDLFGEGSFIGKGIYDVEVFQRACDHFPENAILSHDLLESAFARSGLLSDVELYEDHPSRFLAEVSRRRRWIRGDWQILWWLLPWAPGPDNRWIANSISLLSRWKMLDNLRRSLWPPALLGLLLLGWLFYPSFALAVALGVIAMLATMPLIASLMALTSKPPESTWALHLRDIGWPLLRQALQVVHALMCLPHEAYVSARAIVKTVVRVLCTRRGLLEWQTSSEAERDARTDLGSAYMAMVGQPILAALLLGLVICRGGPLLASAPILGLWMIAPLAAWWLSRPIPLQKPRLTQQQSIFLHKLARRTWRYFETFVTPEQNYLPPDNFQEIPVPTIASRTSPTNIGVGLLANLCAHDFGYCSTEQMLDRTLKTLATMDRLEKFRTHFLNWYDTRTLLPLPPVFVSTVDSGNLAAHLLVLRRGLLEIIDQQMVSPRIFNGIHDTFLALLDAAAGSKQDRHSGRNTPVSSEDLPTIQKMQTHFAHEPSTLATMHEFVERSVDLAAQLKGIASFDVEFQWWVQAFEAIVADHRDHLAQVAPWLQYLRVPQEAAAEFDALRKLLQQLESGPTLREVAALELSLRAAIDAISPDPSAPRPTQVNAWLGNLRKSVADASAHALRRIAALEDAARRCGEFAEMDFSFLFDPSRDLLSIGYKVPDHRLDNGFYDLLASEARLGSFVAIAQGQFGQEHWFALRRLLTSSGGTPALLSWSGSMFEYLMPLLVMPTYENTLLGQTYKAVVTRQIAYGKQRGVPWGMSESGYNVTDGQMNYQYRAFGVPGLGLQRGLADDLVVAPYATVLALMVTPQAACRNLERLAADARDGPYGFYEAVDYTPSRVPRGQTSVNIRQFMAHHEGMSLLSLAYLLLDRPMQRRFNSDPMLRAADLLLQERIPRAVTPVFPHATEAGIIGLAAADEQATTRVFTDPNTPAPEVHLLSNGRYHVMISNAGGGYSRWRDLAVTRWSEDATRDACGAFCYLRDINRDTVWSASHQPTLTVASKYEAIFTRARVEFRRQDNQIETHTQISVSPEDDIELRRLVITNHSSQTQSIQVTSYAEVVLAPPLHDLSHPAFSNLFVQSELLPQRHAILCTRRPRSSQEHPPWMIHLMALEGQEVGQTTFETDRMNFLGRGRTLAQPRAMDAGVRLSNSQGAVLDPVVCIRRTVRIGPGESARLNLVTGMAETREAALVLVEKYHDPRLAERVFELAWTHSHVQLRQLNVTEADAQLYGRLAGPVIYATPLRRANPSLLASNRRGQSGLWGYGISGDLPIVLVRIRDQANLDLVRQAVQAHAYWRLHGLAVDLVIWNDDTSGYRQNLQDTIMAIFLGTMAGASQVDKPGGTFLRRGEQIPEEDRILLQTVARVILFDDAGTLRQQVDRRSRIDPRIPPFQPTRFQTNSVTPAQLPHRDLAFFNGLGGFTRDGREYVSLLHPTRNTPAPWANVIANPQFGTLVSESGSVYTWAENSHEFRLTSWSNDPVGGGLGEGLYIRDEENGRFWSPSPLPARGPALYVVRHGFGYSIFEYEQDGLASELNLYVDTSAPVKFARLKIVNRSGRPRQLSITAYWELVLGELRHKNMMYVVSEIDPVTNAIFVRNAYNTEFPGRVVFVDSNQPTRTYTGDRREFLGRNGTLANPAALRQARLSGRVGAGIDPCAAMQVPLQLDDQQEKEVIFTFGAAPSPEQARQLIQQTRGPDNAQRALEAVWNYWSRTLGVVYIETPDAATNFLANGWLLYQTLSCRMWGRTGFYQSGGAYGFRDQLQDAMALLHAEPLQLREHLLRAAARQFREGDVQHWWHPPQGRGVRTRISDDYLWLPYAVARYVTATGDTGVLGQTVPFLDGRELRPDEDSYYDLPRVSPEPGTLYEHCVRAINHALRFGAHGLPLMGSGDWNDGMNLIGIGGKGESVWLGFFLHDLLNRFVSVALRNNDEPFANKCSTEAAALKQRIGATAWDGQWYLRAFFDNGEPLGSANNPECQIDALPQAWAVLSGAGEPARTTLAMAQVDQRLVHADSRLIQLFVPPFDTSALEPGYIKGYAPGVRENGGQYTHAAIWTIMACAAMGQSERTWKLLSMINPINHASTPQQIKLYKVEPYVMAADVYAAVGRVGQGGWTWYTGSAGWMYRLITESLLGLQLQVDQLLFTPCLPAAWKTFKIHYRFRETFYHITIRNGGGKVVTRILADGAEQPQKSVHLIDDRNPHNIEVEID